MRDMSERFGRLTVVSHFRIGRRKYANTICDCGTTKEIREDGLKNGSVVSCGCFRLEQVTKSAWRHGLSRKPEYKVWASMIQRCHNENNAEFKNYGGRGIEVCERWHDFANFIADMGRRPFGMTVERKDNDSSYSPGNCIWASQKTQNANKRHNRFVEIDGRRMIASEACRLFDISLTSSYRRSRRKGETLQQAVDHFISLRGGQ